METIFCASTDVNVISLVAYKLCRSCPHPEKLHFYEVSYRWKIVRSTNPGNPQPGNYFEPNPQYIEEASNLEGDHSNKQKKIRHKLFGYE